MVADLDLESMLMLNRRLVADGARSRDRFLLCMGALLDIDIPQGVSTCTSLEASYRSLCFVTVCEYKYKYAKCNDM